MNRPCPPSWIMSAPPEQARESGASAAWADTWGPLLVQMGGSSRGPLLPLAQVALVRKPTATMLGPAPVDETKGQDDRPGALALAPAVASPTAFTSWGLSSGSQCRRWRSEFLVVGESST